ncbi:TspO/MBR family protein [Natronocalculus amylovorans]|uniref:Tryptophan-rich sensory protein n=1 Tax=Natronocalculus amylovorans TaxID=2917812 RepID=A0AAE3K9W9_9EURY|nr:TspO/MBR family protein [Natronocalculus amylovorans]MCL9817975.1 tryptophan-rich sensory protein [Natronocalculus amylovorans]
MSTLVSNRSGLGSDDIGGLLLSIVAINLIGSSGVVFTSPGSAWFQSLTLPWFYPPSVLFGIVWTALFTLMGIALYLVYRTPDSKARTNALALFGIQMVVNVAWSPTFFTLERPDIALGVIVVLFGLIVGTIRWFRVVDRRAALLLVPYLFWVGFATLLTASIWYLNAPF